MGVSFPNRRFQNGDYVWYTPASLISDQKNIGVITGFYRFHKNNEFEYHIKPLFTDGFTRREDDELEKATEDEVLIYGLSR